MSVGEESQMVMTLKLEVEEVLLKAVMPVGMPPGRM